MNKDRRVRRPQHLLAVTREVHDAPRLAFVRRLAPDQRLLREVPEQETLCIPDEQTSAVRRNADPITSLAVAVEKSFAGAHIDDTDAGRVGDGDAAASGV